MTNKRKLLPNERVEYIKRAQKDPVWFQTAVLKSKPYDKQVEIIESVRDNRQTSVVGANGTGKDWEIGRIVSWWQSSRYPAKTVVIGPTNRQVSDIVWREVRSCYNQAVIPLGGTMTPRESRWEGSGDMHYAIGFSTDKPYNILGFHPPNLLVVVTEAHNLGEDYFTQIKRLQPTRLLLSGNAFTQSGEFFDSFHTKQHLYNNIKITAFDSPNVKSGADVPGLVTQEDIDGYRLDWGEDSDLYKGTVLAEFVSGPEGLYSMSDLETARVEPLKRHVIPSANIAEPPTIRPIETYKVSAGLDVAGPGEDETALTLRRGPNIIGQFYWPEADPRGQIVNVLRTYGKNLEVVNIDVVGIGYYLYLHLKDLGFPVQPINVGLSSSQPERFNDFKAEIYWTFRDLIKQNSDGTKPIAVAGLLDELTISQLASIRWATNSKGQIQIESKKEAKKRGNPSPDRAESVILSFINPPTRRRASVSSG